MQKFLLFLCVVASATLASTASAAAPTRISIPIDSTAPSRLLTSACGFDVSITQVGTLKAIVFHDQSGAIIRELDTQPDTQLILSSSTTGKSFAFPFASVFRFEYPNGTTPGSEAVVTRSEEHTSELQSHSDLVC